MKELRGFIGLCSYYRKFVAQFTTIAEPLTRLTKTNVTFVWDEQAQTAFDKLKLFLTSKPILAFANFSKRFLLFCDASNSGIGAILSQVQNGKEAVIYYVSRHLNHAERNYAKIEKEALAIVFAAKQFHHYIYGHEVVIVTDHAPLVYL